MSELIDRLKEKDSHMVYLSRKALEPYMENISKSIDKYYGRVVEVEIANVVRFPQADSRYIMLSGFHKHQVGEVILRDGMEVIIDSSNVDKYVSMLRVIFHIDSLESDDLIKVFTSFRNLMDLASVVEPTEYEIMIDDVDFDCLNDSNVSTLLIEHDAITKLSGSMPQSPIEQEIEEAQQREYVQDDRPSIEIKDFDLDSLSDEQAEQLFRNLDYMEKKQ